MQDDCITVKLRLQGVIVLAVNETPTRIEVVARYKDEEATCPRCERLAWQVHQWHLQRKRDAKLWRKDVWIALFKRRFRCRHCRKVFMESDPACGSRRRTTVRLRETVARRAEEAAVRAVAREEGVSEGLVERSWLEARGVLSPTQPHTLVGMDGFWVRRPGRMWTGMWDLETRMPVAFVPGERQVDVERMLERYAPRDTVRAVAIDLSEPYRQAIQVVLPDAAVVADKFHVLALAGRALREVHGEKRRRGTVAWLLQRGVERLSQEERERLIASLSTDSQLGTSVGAERGPALGLQTARASGGSSGAGQLDRGREGQWPKTLSADSGYSPQMAHGGAELLAIPHDQRAGGGQA